MCDLFACVTFLLPPGIKALKLNHLKIEYSQSVIKLKLRICMPLEIKNLDNIHLDNEGRMKWMNLLTIIFVYDLKILYWCLCYTTMEI